MMASMVAGLEDWGVPDARIQFEAFGPASVKRRALASPAQEAGTDIQVTFARSGTTAAWRRSAGTLLDFAEQEGIPVDSSCRSGACGTCRTTITAGEVSYNQPPDYDPEPGTCLRRCTPRPALPEA
jgi:ferredoxin